MSVKKYEKNTIKSTFSKVMNSPTFNVGPLISVITVVLNGQGSIEETIKSIISQTYRRIEVIVVDGGSKDETIPILSKYRDFISFQISEVDNGIYDAMNKGILAARGDYLYFLNCGDLFVNAYVLQNIAKFIADAPTDIIYGDICTIDKEGAHTLIKSEIRSNYELFKNTICHQAVFTPKRIFEVMGGFDTSYKLCADREWMLRASKKYGYGVKYVNAEVAVFDRGGVSSRRRVLGRMEDMKVNLIYFGWSFFPYLAKQVFDKLIRTLEI